MTSRAVVGVGSNLDPEEHVVAALEALAAEPGVGGLRASSAYRTEPYGADPGSPPFVNLVVVVDTTLSPIELRGALKGIESHLGRPARHSRTAPRVIDLDLLFYGGETAPGPGLVLPHPDGAKPYFAIPLAEVLPDFADPVTGEPMRDRAARLGRSGIEPLPQLSAAVASLFPPG